MVKISIGTIKEAAKNVNELMESASPEMKMLLENPNFATGLCLVLHKELVQLRDQVQELQGTPQPPQTASSGQAAISPISPQKAGPPAQQARQPQPAFQSQIESREQQPAEPTTKPSAQAQHSDQQALQKEELFV